MTPNQPDILHSGTSAEFLRDAPLQGELAELGKMLSATTPDDVDRIRAIVRKVNAITPSSRAGLTFGEAVEAMKVGERVAREGWNGKGMFVWLNRGSTDCLPDRETTIEGVSDHLFDLGDDDTIVRLPNINMRAATGSTVTGWLASQTDILAEDWGICI
jgi:hypothetical protein